MWNERYSTAEYAYGKKPNNFIVDNLTHIGQDVLLPADGEGRNAVFLAQQGRDVTSFDASSEGVAKAQKLAQQHNVKIDAHIATAQEFDFGSQKYDSIILCYFHMPVVLRADIHRRCIESLKPNGVIILEGFSTNQLQYNSGGPKNPDMLFSEDIIASDFSTLKTLHLSEQKVTLDEGEYHQGQASVIRYIGRL